MFIPVGVADVNFRVTCGEHEILTYEGLQAHYIAVLNRLSVAYRVVKKHSHGSKTTQGIKCMKRSMLNYRMLFQFDMAGRMYLSN